ncbi:MAG: hypothetical protein H7839_22700 [Magnetococcus sp. YQC-5]
MTQAATFEDVWRMFQEMAREDRERREEMAREDRERWERLERQMQETDRKLKEVSTLVGNLGGRWGDFVEGLVAPACETLFAQRGIPVHKVSRKIKVILPNGRRKEIDVLVENTEMVALVEVKSALTIEDVREHMVRLVDCKVIFPNKRVIGAVAGIVIDETVDLFAMRNGLFVIVQAGDQVRLVNDESFVPREW